MVSDGLEKRLLIESAYASLLPVLRKKDTLSYIHSVSVGNLFMLFCFFLGDTFGFSPDLLSMIGALHDCAKIFIPDIILKAKKVYAIGSEERRVLTSHTERVEELLGDLDEVVIAIAKYHHEWYVPSELAYPGVLFGDKIPVPVRILAIIDVAVALMEERPYKSGKSISEMLKIVKEGSGTHFDPFYVSEFERFVYSSSRALDSFFQTMLPDSLRSYKV